MTIDHNVINSLMVWARTQAPLDSNSLGMDQLNRTHVKRRRVRMEIAAERGLVTVETDRGREFDPDVLMCRVYLAEPRNCDGTHTGGVVHMGCDHQPIAETRIA